MCYVCVLSLISVLVSVLVFVLVSVFVFVLVLVFVFVLVCFGFCFGLSTNTGKFNGKFLAMFKTSSQTPTASTTTPTTPPARSPPLAPLSLSHHPSPILLMPILHHTTFPFYALAPLHSHPFIPFLHHFLYHHLPCLYHISSSPHCCILTSRCFLPKHY